MGLDLGLPVQSNGKSRDEILIVSYDGFIKNPSEGIIRTMKRDYDDWIDKYPDLEMFEEMTQTDLYDNTSLFQPLDLLRQLSNGNLSDEEIQKDINSILPNIFLNNSRITVFEYSLFNILKEKYIKKCYLYREYPFYKNDIQYLKKNYGDLFGKIELVSEVSYESLFEEVHPTTIFLTDPTFVLDYVRNNVSKEYTEGMVFILLNTSSIVDYDEKTDQFIIEESFRNEMTKIGEDEEYALLNMYNQQIDTDKLDEESEDSDSNDEEE